MAAAVNHANDADKIAIGDVAIGHDIRPDESNADMPPVGRTRCAAIRMHAQSVVQSLKRGRVIGGDAKPRLCRQIAEVSACATVETTTRAIKS